MEQPDYELREEEEAREELQRFIECLELDIANQLPKLEEARSRYEGMPQWRFLKRADLRFNLNHWERVVDLNTHRLGSAKEILAKIGNQSRPGIIAQLARLDDWNHQSVDRYYSTTTRNHLLRAIGQLEGDY
jgi:hypothetical protein